jgi:hypothetical protein
MLMILQTTPIYACAMTSVVCNGTHGLWDSLSGIGDGTSDGESNWLRQKGSSNPDGHGMIYYHKSGYPGHSHKVLDYQGAIDTVTFNGNNHLYRKVGDLGNNSENLFSFVRNSKVKHGKIFIGHVRKRSQYANEPFGVFAPLIYRSVVTVNGVPDTTDYSFTHHGGVSKSAMVNVTKFYTWLENYDIQNIMNGVPTYYSVEECRDDYVDSDYLFLWLVMHIEECDNNVRDGLVAGLSALVTHNISGHKNIFFSDGNGVYAYTNEMDYTQGNQHLMSFKANEGSLDLISYLIRSSNAIEAGWTPFEAHNLYYFPTQGQMEVTYNADISVPVRFELKQGLNWVGFPVLEGTYGLDPDYTLRDVNQFAINLQTKNGTQPDEWSYQDNPPSWQNDAFLTRTNGYILNLSSASPVYEYSTCGQRTQNSTTLSLYQNNENWVPYFIPYSQTPENAFGNNYSHITAIYAQDWYRYKYKGQWYGYIQQGATGTLDYGKMYKVYVDQSISNFTWSASARTQSFVKEATRYFQFEEQPDYQAIVIASIPDNPSFDEIGVLKDGVCVGALKFNGYPINLQVYDNSTPDEYDYILYTGAKNSNYLEKKFSSASIDINNSIVDNGRNLFSLISLTGGQESETIVSPVLSASIYPNPMHGITNIEIQATAKSSVEISIYNLKGQLVKSFGSTDISKGNTTLIWNGKTEDGRPVAKGIYFCRIQSPNNLLTKKLIVLD